MYERLARWCFNNAWKVVGAWVLAFAAIAVATGAVGPAYDGSFEIPESDSASGFEVIETYFGGAGAGLPGSIVFEAEQGVADADVTAAMNALQNARGDLRAAAIATNANCATYFADPLPLTKCGQDTVGRTVERNDIFCETITWQYEELGDGNPDEFKTNGCVLPATQADSTQGVARKNGFLKGHEEL